LAASTSGSSPARRWRCSTIQTGSSSGFLLLHQEQRELAIEGAGPIDVALQVGAARHRRIVDTFRARVP
jgi:hypothetical protein